MVKHAYIHIPFCKNICNYCDFCKMFYNDKWVNNYLEELKKEVDLNYNNDLLDTIYIGGGTPSCLNTQQLKKLFEITNKLKVSPKLEFTFECNLEDITEEKLQILQKNKVNRISIGIQTFNIKHQHFINRKLSFNETLEKINLIKKYIDNINVDLMYGFKEQTLEELKEDLDLFLSLNVNHISTYSLIIEPHTKLYIDDFNSIDEDLDYRMFLLINETLKNNNFNHYEISNYCLSNFESKHNLSYWNNEFYYGFGLGSSGYINNIRYDNTKGLNNYLKGNYRFNEEKLSKQKTMENEMILGLRKISGVNEIDFFKKYNCKIEDVFDIENLLNENKLIKKDNYIFINPIYLYLSNDILINFID